MNVPKLSPTDRSREYNSYSQQKRDKVIYNYLFNGLSHREFDKEILVVIRNEYQDNKRYELFPNNYPLMRIETIDLAMYKVSHYTEYSYS